MTLSKIKKYQSLELQLDIGKMEKFYQILILKILSENSLYKEYICKSLETRLGYQLNLYLVDSLLDTLWFEEMIKTEHRKGKCAFSLTKKGIKTINIKNARARIGHS